MSGRSRVGRGKGRCSSFEKPSFASVGGSSSGRFHPPGWGAGFGAEGDLSSYGFSPDLVPKVSKGRAESPLVRPQTHTPCPGQGLTCRLRRGWWGCRPEGGSTFFRSERKYQRKPAARRLQRRPAPLRVAGFGLREPCGLSSTSVRCAHPPGKRLLLPILTAGLAMSRAMELAGFHIRAERARARLFLPSKWAGLFPSAAYRRSAPPQLAQGRLKWQCLGCFGGN